MNNNPHSYVIHQCKLEAHHRECLMFNFNHSDFPWSKVVGSSCVCCMINLCMQCTRNVPVTYQNVCRHFECPKRITKMLIRLLGSAGWSAPLLLANFENRFSCVAAHISFVDTRAKDGLAKSLPWGKYNRILYA